jgi:hypothetical protein
MQALQVVPLVVQLRQMGLQEVQVLPSFQLPSLQLKQLEAELQSLQRGGQAGQALVSK